MIGIDVIGARDCAVNLVEYDACVVNYVEYKIGTINPQYVI